MRGTQKGVSNFLILLLILGITVIFSEGGCGSSGGSGSGGDTVTLTGDFKKGSYAKSNDFNGYLRYVIPNAYAFDPTTVDKTIVFFRDGSYKLASVSDGKFTIQVERGSPAGMIFVNSQDKFQGYLTLDKGLDSLPLNSVNDSVDEIDLGELSISNSTVTPSNNIFDEEIPLSMDERKALGAADDLFASVVKNPDVDGNGKIDILEDKYYDLEIFNYMYGGDFLNGNLTASVNSDADVMKGYKLAIQGKSEWSDPIFSGPSGSGYDYNKTDAKEDYGDFVFYYAPYVSDPSVPPEGDYTVEFNTSTQYKSLNFYISDQTDAVNNVVLPVPTVVLNSDDTVNKVKWNYRTLNSTSLNADCIIDRLEIEIRGTGSHCNISKNDIMYRGAIESPSTTEHKLECQNLLWDNITRIYITYDDVFGNDNIISWEK